MATTAPEVEVPEMNGTLVELIALSRSPLRTVADTSRAVQKMAGLLVHIYQMQKNTNAQLATISKQFETHAKTESKILQWFLDKVLPQIVTLIILGILYMVFDRK